ncbi:MAG: bifunctional protein-serine/threonine kinase/phosphatase [Hyphomicrobiales bacterium]|nr:MAG: bifunctional protein-serine/threonine kinase/phosphatase [Hyphomicrobiales bacterium]
MPLRSDHDLKVDVGFATERGRRPDNQDYVGVCFGPRGGESLQGVVAAIADGVGGHKGGRAAAETAVRAFIDGYYAQPETLGVIRAAARSLEAANAWIAAQARVDPELEGMATTFSSIILSRRNAFVLHLGDTRIYRLDADGGLQRLTKDHVAGRGDFAHVLRRAVGFEETALFDQASCALSLHDRFLLCSDGVHGVLSNALLLGQLAERRSPQETSEAIVRRALEVGSNDNVTALVVDVVDLPPADEHALARFAADLPICEVPREGEVVDDFRIDGALSQGRYSSLMRATDLQSGKDVVIKFPKPDVADDETYRVAFITESWVAARVRSPFIGEIVDVAPMRQTRLYSVMPFYDGETLEQRLSREPKIDLTEGIPIALRLSRAVATLHRSGIIHRDVKPENVILTRDGGLRLIDLGVCRAPHLEDIPDQFSPGTPSYMAPELFEGATGNESSDLYALGVTIYRLFCRAYPHGEIEPFSKPRFAAPKPVLVRRPDLPAWLDATISKAIAVRENERFGDVLEFAFELENDAARTRPAIQVKKPLYQRNPLLFWQALSMLLMFLLIISLALR